MAIRYDKKFNHEIARIVKNFNSKITRLEGMERVLAPKTVLVSELKSQYSERNDLKRRLRELQLFSEKGIEEEVLVGDKSTTRYEMKLDTRRVARTKANLTREIKKAEQSARTANTVYVRNLRKRREILNQPLAKLTEKQRTYRSKIIESEIDPKKKQGRFYHNLFQMIYKTAYVAGMKPKDVEKALAVFRRLTPAQLADAVGSIKELSAFTLKYRLLDKLGEGGNQQIEEALTNMTEAFERVQDFYS